MEMHCGPTAATPEPLLASADSTLSASEREKPPEDTAPLFAPEVLRCTRNGTIVGRSSLEEAYGEAQQANWRQQLLQSLQGMSHEEKFRCCSQFKEKGNAYYAAGEHLEAISCYERGLMALDFGCSEKQDTEVRNQLLLPLLLNLSACLLKLHEYTKARAVCNIALSVDPHCFKALYRRGVAQKELGDLDAAKLDFRKILSLCEEQQHQQQPDQQLPQAQPHDGEDSGQPIGDGNSTQDKGQQPASGPASSQEILFRRRLRKTNATTESDSITHEVASAAPTEALVRDNAQQTRMLVLQCKRQLADVHHQQRQYNAACSRMFRLPPQAARTKRHVSQEQPGQKQQPEAAVVAFYNSRFGLPSWITWPWACTCFCNRRHSK